MQWTLGEVVRVNEYTSTGNMANDLRTVNWGEQEQAPHRWLQWHAHLLVHIAVHLTKYFYLQAQNGCHLRMFKIFAADRFKWPVKWKQQPNFAHH